MDDKNKLIDQLAGLIGGENGMQNISSLLQGFGTSQANKTSEPAPSSAPMPSITSASEIKPNIDIQRIKGIYDSIASDNDPRINLLTALLPYMGEKRSGRLQNAVKAIKMTKIVGILGSIDKL